MQFGRLRTYHLILARSRSVVRVLWAATRPIPQCSAGELSPLVHRPPSSASLCTHPRRRSKAPDPKEKVKEWKKQMRGEERKLDRQITSEARLPPRRAAALADPSPANARNKKRGDEGEAVGQAGRQAGRHVHRQDAREGDRALSQGHGAAVHVKGADELGRHADAEPAGCARPPAVCCTTQLRTCCLTAASHSGLWVCRPQRNKR